MFDRFYLYTLFKFFNKNSFFFEFEIFSLKKKILNKILKNFFFFFKKNIENNLYLFRNNKKNYISYFGILKYLKFSKQTPLLKKVNKNSLFNLKLNFLNNNLSTKKSNYLSNDLYFNLYQNYALFFKKNTNFYNIFYYKIILKKKQKFILNSNIFKENFYKIINFIINSSYLNLSPLVVLNEKLVKNENFFKLYLTFLVKNLKYSYIFIVDPFIKIKYLCKLKKMNLPIFCVTDETINQDWIDYPIFIKRVDLFNIHFFFYLYLNIFFYGKVLKKSYYNDLYKNYLNLNFIKENIFRNEII